MKIATTVLLPCAVLASQANNKTTATKHADHLQLQIDEEGDDELIESSFLQTNTVGINPPEFTEVAVKFYH